MKLKPAFAVTSRTLSVLLLPLLLAGCGKPDKAAEPGDAPGRPALFERLPPTEQELLRACGVGPDELDRQMVLSQEAFDQDLEGGWREIAKQDGCREAASLLLQAYLRYSVYPVEDQSMLRWHAGQLEAMAGDTLEAIALIRGTYDDSPEPDAVAWRLYARGTIAFLQRDRIVLSDQRDKLAALPVSEERKAERRQFLEDNPDVSMPEGFVDEPQNLAVLDRLLRCFDSDYASAYDDDC